tara:strand:- start:600 stop:1196 length:597 start_codon:yes stop_codon:yes gene_type:complete
MMKDRVEKLDMERLRELGYTLERVLTGDRDIRAKSREELAKLVADALEELEIEQPEAFAAIWAEYELDLDDKADTSDEAETDLDGYTSSPPSSSPEEETLEVHEGEGEEEQPLSKSQPRQNPSPYEYVQVAGHGADAELRYGDVVPSPKPELYEVVPFSPLSSKEAMAEVLQEGATLNVDPRWSHGPQEEWARKRAKR